MELQALDTDNSAQKTLDANDVQNCLLYLTLEVGDADAASAALAAALSAGPVASVLLKPMGEAKLTPPEIKPLIEACAASGAVALIADDTALAKNVDADGVHISWREDVVTAYKQARETLGPDAAIGGDAGRSRHAAMQLGETGADYVAFGIPTHVKDRTTAEQRQHQLIAWWAEIFEPACVAMNTTDPLSVGALVEAGADFIDVSIPHGTSPADVRDLVTAQFAILGKHSAIRLATLTTDLADTGSGP